MTGAELPLRDIHLPPAVSGWPPAPGWWMLAVLVFLALALAGAFAVIRRRSDRARRQALAELADAADAREINRLLKRAALAYFERSRVAPLHGLAWFQFLDANLPGDEPLFGGDAALWQQLLYDRQASPADIARFRQLAERWLNRALPPPTWQTMRQLLKRRSLLRA